MKFKKICMTNIVAETKEKMLWKWKFFSLSSAFSLMLVCLIFLSRCAFRYFTFPKTSQKAKKVKKPWKKGTSITFWLVLSEYYWANLNDWWLIFLGFGGKCVFWTKIGFLGSLNAINLEIGYMIKPNVGSTINLLPSDYLLFCRNIAWWESKAQSGDPLTETSSTPTLTLISS